MTETLAKSFIQAQLSRVLRGHIAGQEFWDTVAAVTIDLPADHPACHLANAVEGIMEAADRGEFPYSEQVAILRRMSHYIPIRDGGPRTARQHRRRARKVKRHEALGTVWKMRESQYVLGSLYRYPDRDPSLPLTIEECGTLWRMEGSGRYRKGKPPTNPRQVEYLSREYRSLAAKDAAHRHFLAVRAAVAEGLPVPAPTLVTCPGLIPTEVKA